MPDLNGSYADYRLNFEQQGKRAKELLKAARAREPEALARFKSPPKLAEAQYLIARELRFENWAALKRHIAAMTLAREAMNASALDSDLQTLHIRGGHDLIKSSQEAGFRGEWYVDVYPYFEGPVREGPGCLEQRARFIVDRYGADFDPPLEYEGQLQGREDGERELHDSADYERVVLWFEYDCVCQLALIHLLGHYAIHRRPPLLELINIDDFPGARRFGGLGELPPETLRMLWTTRKPVSSAQLQLGLEAWRALANPDPRSLAAIVRRGTPALPLLAPALHRHLRELPSSVNGLSHTEEWVLTLMAEPFPLWPSVSLGRIYWHMHEVTDPLPGLPDMAWLRCVLAMEAASGRLLTRSPGLNYEGRAHPPWTDVVVITDLGRSVLRGEVDFRSLNPSPRWVGGVEIAAGNVDWRWDEQRRDAVTHES
jgi:hypothetical protein